MRIRRIVAVTGVIVLAGILLFAGCAAPAPPPTPTPAPAPAPTPTPAPAPTYSAENPIVLKYGYHGLPTAAEAKWVHTYFVEEVERRTEGRIKATFFPGAVLAKTRDQYDAVLSGIMDVSYWSAGYDPGRHQLVTIGELPLASSTSANVTSIMWALTQRGWFDKEFGDVKILAVYGSLPYDLFLNKKVTSLEDLKGVTIRAHSASFRDILERLGASPVELASGEVYPALERGVVDGIMYRFGLIEQYKHYEVIKYVTLAGLCTSVSLIIMNREVFESLTPEDQHIVEMLGLELALRRAAINDREEAFVKAKFREMGMEFITLTPEESARWSALIMPLVDKWISDREAKGLPAKELFEEWLSLWEKFGLEPPY